MEMLSWSGVEIDEGPFHGGDHGPYLQVRCCLYSSLFLAHPVFDTMIL